MAGLEAFFRTLDGWLGSATWFPFLLIGVGLFFTLYLKFPQIRFFRHAWRVVRGQYSAKGDPGDTSHFQALSTALSGTVGTGNIGGVAFAIFLGGPAALFWMWATAFFGMTTKFVEVSLSHKYRVTDEQGRIAGGPMYYMERGLNMRWLAVFFAIAVVISSFGTGNMPQSNNMASGLQASFGIPTWISGLVFAILLGLVIVGGIRRIARVSSTIVPFMGMFYFFGSLAVVISNIEQVVPAFLSVFQQAFTGTAATGGFLGASFAYAFNRGVNRGLFSNEAGQGSAPIAHAAARTEEPVSEGVVAILEPFIDTLIICTLTGMVILASGVWKEKFENVFAPIDTDFVAGSYSEDDAQHVNVLFGYLIGTSDHGIEPLNAELHAQNGVVPDGDFTVIHNRSIAEDVHYLRGGQPYSGPLVIAGGKLRTPDIVVHGRSLLHSVPLTVEAFKRSFLGEFGQYAVTISLVLFVFSTAIAWSYYGDRSMTYLFGARAVMPYRIVYVIGFFLATVVDTSFIWLVSAVALALMALPNLVGLLLMHREVRQMTESYWSKFH